MPTPLPLTGALLAALLAPALAANAQLDIGRDGAVEIGPAGQVTGLRLAGRSVATGKAGGFRLVEILAPDGRTTAPAELTGNPLAGPAGDDRPGPLRVRYDLSDRKLRLDARFTQLDGAVQVAGRISSLDADRDRAVQLDFVLPIRCEGWTFESGIEAAEKIDGPGPYPRAEHRRLAFGDPGAKELIHTSRLWFASVSDGQRGVAIGIDPASPAMFRILADPAGLRIRYHFGLTPLTKKFPSAAKFRFVVCAIDGRWGIRSAAETFYRLFPEFFRRRAKRFGSWAGADDITNSDLPDKQDFHITYGDNDYHWNNGQYWPNLGRKLKALNITCFHWREPWSYFLTGSVKTNSAEQELQLLRDQAAGRTDDKTQPQMCDAPIREAARGVLNSYMTDASGMPLRVRWAFKCRFFAPNMDPELPKPNRATLADDYQFRWLDRWSDPSFDGPRNIAWDSATRWTGIEYFNYRRELFATADYPLACDPRDGRVVQVKALTDREFAVWDSAKVRAAGAKAAANPAIKAECGLVMCNSGFESLLFYGDCMDVPVLESHAHEQPRWPERMGLYRTLIATKPLSFYRDIAPAGMRRCLLYGLAPGGDCLHEAYRPLTKKYMPTIEAAARAGWRPVTHARVEGAYVERFGDRPGELYMTVMNRDADRARDVELVVDAKALGLDPAAAVPVELIERRAVARSVRDGKWVLGFRLEPDEALAIRIDPTTGEKD